jgi:hypothetical protein
VYKYISIHGYVDDVFTIASITHYNHLAAFSGRIQAISGGYNGSIGEGKRVVSAKSFQ